MTEFELNGQTYRMGKLNAFAQFHVSRRIAPIIPTLVPVFMKLSKDGSLTDDLGSLAEVLGPFADGIAAMTDEASEYVIGNCLSVIQRQNGSLWAPVWNAQNRVCMFDDIELITMIQLVVRVIQQSLGPFMAGLLMTPESDPASKG